MHMSDALISPPVGGAMWAVSAVTLVYCAKKISGKEKETGHSNAPMTAMMAAFVFAAQMINFTIPGTGSSGHIGGGILLAAILGAWPGFLAMASILALQALLFGDGGLLAYGCNLFNLGFIPCLLVYPLIFKPMAGQNQGFSQQRIMSASVLAAVIGLQAGAFCVVLQTLFSGITKLPFGDFLLLMQPIHLAIGVVEGLATAAILTFVYRAQPVLLTRHEANPAADRKDRKVVISLLVATLLVAGVCSWFASTKPDGLEWAIERTAGEEELALPETGTHQSLERIQGELAVLPDYGFPESESENPAQEEQAERWPNVSIGTTTAGLLGSGMFILLALLAWLYPKKDKQGSQTCNP